MDKATYVLLGVVLAVLLNAVKEWWFQRGKSRKDLEYLAIRISCMLDTFVSGCSDVAADDGLHQGQYGPDGCRDIQVTPPSFEPIGVDVEWKSLPTALMYEVLNFPNLVEAANHRISGVFEYAASAPDYEDGFEERQLQYADLGLKASALSAKLRKTGGMPPVDTPASEDWNPIQFMQEKAAEVKRTKEVRAARHQDLLDKLDASA